MYHTKVTKITTVAPLRRENSIFLVFLMKKCKFVGEVKLEPNTEAKTSDTSTPLEKVIRVRGCVAH